MAIRSTSMRKIKVMISSQCKREFPTGGRILTDIRRDIRDRIESQKLAGQQIFDVWINEDSPGRGTNKNSWDACLDEVRKSDVLIVLATDHAGWALSDGDIGICHAELMTAHNTSPAKIRVIKLEGTAPTEDEHKSANERFRSYINQINPFRSAVSTEVELFNAVEQAITDAVSELVGLGVREASKGAFSTGDALTWSRFSLTDRAQLMRETISSALKESGATELSPTELAVAIKGESIVFHLHAAPGNLTIPLIREMVGRPFLEDHRKISAYSSLMNGPVHIVACQAGTTEAQARAILGFPDATFVSPNFGIFAADNIQQIQFALLRNCRDATTTRNAIHRFLQWLRESGEDALVVNRARRRRAIVTTIATQLAT